MCDEFYDEFSVEIRDKSCDDEFVAEFHGKVGTKDRKAPKRRLISL